MGLSVNILTSGFLVTVIIFFLLMGILFYQAYTKMGAVLLENDSARNDLTQLDNALNAIRVAYILAFIGIAIVLILALLYAGHETVFTPSEYWHLVLYLIAYILLVISVIYAAIALNRLYDTRIMDRNGADAYIWAGLLMAVFAFVGLTATGSGRLGMNIVRVNTRARVEAAEAQIHTHLPAIHAKVEQVKDKVDSHLAVAHAKVDDVRSTLEAHLPSMRGKVDDLHAASGLSAPEEEVVVTRSVRRSDASSSNASRASGMLLPETYSQSSRPHCPPQVTTTTRTVSTPSLLRV